MEEKDYCTYVNAELIVWKAKLHDVMTKMDKVPTEGRQQLFEEVNGLHIVMAELEDVMAELGDRVEKIRTECPVVWKPEQEKIQAKLADSGRAGKKK